MRLKAVSYGCFHFLKKFLYLVILLKTLISLYRLLFLLDLLFRQSYWPYGLSVSDVCKSHFNFLSHRIAYDQQYNIESLFSDFNGNDSNGSPLSIICVISIPSLLSIKSGIELELQRAFSEFVEIHLFWISVVSFLIVNHLHIFGVSSTWLWYITIIIYSWILFPRYLLGFLYQLLFSC